MGKYAATHTEEEAELPTAALADEMLLDSEGRI